MPAKKGSTKKADTSKKTTKTSTKDEKDVKVWRQDGKIHREKRLAKVAAEVSEANILSSTRTRPRKDFNYAETLKVESLQRKKGGVYTIPERKKGSRKSKNASETRTKGVKKQKKTTSKKSSKKDSTKN